MSELKKPNFNPLIGPANKARYESLSSITKDEKLELDYLDLATQMGNISLNNIETDKVVIKDVGIDTITKTSLEVIVNADKKETKQPIESIDEKINRLVAGSVFDLSLIAPKIEEKSHTDIKDGAEAVKTKTKKRSRDEDEDIPKSKKQKGQTKDQETEKKLSLIKESKLRKSKVARKPIAQRPKSIKSRSKSKSVKPKSDKPKAQPKKIVNIKEPVVKASRKQPGRKTKSEASSKWKETNTNGFIKLTCT
ncbi:hypothetical protein BN7_4583 [Wickerhamomyces ciferrii]|uniref:Uncharacterized protein n=1 Tax=Wickerhamomyces ciferrii (strain ATCC 14091 / BCRC 22168 / CBS 111 / JCM 3599 / NBRC 0793 / NRRL Y-1031 F-60-10) TaxID=1206466 RepID=K0KU98_WICCF|nr:uncharacterized protein BN7_4583 [Wickerhamomyces ciferrii]CCH45004.1 hypothetical protein BN7_4583 [Wickerhamomyces ciferrii]